jgi:hypothetical protein
MRRLAARLLRLLELTLSTGAGVSWGDAPVGGSGTRGSVSGPPAGTSERLARRQARLRHPSTLGRMNQEWLWDHR